MFSMSLQSRVRVKWGCCSGYGCGVPDCGVKLKGKDDVLVAADLADKASLGAQVTVVDMLRGEVNQGFEESFIHPLCNLQGQVDTSLRWPHCTTIAPTSGLPWFHTGKNSLRQAVDAGIHLHLRSVGHGTYGRCP